MRSHLSHKQPSHNRTRIVVVVANSLSFTSSDNGQACSRPLILNLPSGGWQISAVPAFALGNSLGLWKQHRHHLFPSPCTNLSRDIHAPKSLSAITLISVNNWTDITP